jgi:hypothetical protein
MAPARSTVVTNGNLASNLIITISLQRVTLLYTWWHEEPKHIHSCLSSYCSQYSQKYDVAKCVTESKVLYLLVKICIKKQLINSTNTCISYYLSL